MQIKSTIQNPFFWFLFLFISYSSYKNLNDLSSVITSDGRGYYAYLPAVFIHGNFQKSSQQEKSAYTNEIEQLYLYKDKNGELYNKYFPGVAVLQLPFFLIAYFISYISDLSIDGYNSTFLFFNYLGSLFYSILGLIIYFRFVKKFYLNFDNLNWVITVVCLSTPILFYTLNTTSFSHLFSFFLFGLFGLQIINLNQKITKVRLVSLGIIIGLIFLIRPTNILIITIIPFLLRDKIRFINFVKSFLNLKISLLFYVAFLSICSILLFIWKWESGSWIVWSYSGEGFNFFNPKIIECLFSFRAGLFLQTPIIILAVLGIFLIKNNYQLISWFLYFSIVVWVLSAWWCWDYESSFSNRAYTEHMFFLTLPIYHFFNFISNQKIRIGILAIFGVISIIRYVERTTNFMADQHFTYKNYFASLVFWDSQNKNRWNFTKSCVPFGKKVESKLILSDASVHNINSNDEFIFTAVDTLSKNRSNERYYYTVTLDKKIEDNIEGVLLVVDGSSFDFKSRYYKSIDLFNDRFEGQKDWKKLEFEGIVHDNFQQFEKVAIYIWNQGKRNFKIRNIQIRVEKYKS